MGNCMKSVDPLTNSLPRDVTVNSNAIRESGLPIVFVIGGPGAGKRTLCNEVAGKYNFSNLLATDIIRHEVAKRSDKAFALACYMTQGRLVPPNVLVDLIAMHMLSLLDKKKGFIVSGFPRDKEQCKLFDKEIRPPDLVLLLNVRNSVMIDREMAKTVKVNERPDIDVEHVKHEINEFQHNKKWIIKHYTKLVVTIDAENDAATVFEDACKSIDNLLQNHVRAAEDVASTSKAGVTSQVAVG